MKWWFFSTKKKGHVKTRAELVTGGGETCSTRKGIWGAINRSASSCAWRIGVGFRLTIQALHRPPAATMESPHVPNTCVSAVRSNSCHVHKTWGLNHRILFLLLTSSAAICSHQPSGRQAKLQTIIHFNTTGETCCRSPALKWPTDCHSWTATSNRELTGMTGSSSWIPKPDSLCKQQTWVLDTLWLWHPSQKTGDLGANRKASHSIPSSLRNRLHWTLLKNYAKWSCDSGNMLIVSNQNSQAKGGHQNQVT